MKTLTYEGRTENVHEWLYDNVNDMRNIQTNDRDIFVIVDGRERVGKSVLAQVIGWIASRGTLTLKNICLTAEEFADRVTNCDKGDVIIFDECYLGMSSSDAMRRYNRMIKQLVVTCGQKNLFVILVLPSVFDINKYMALHRADALIHAFEHKRRRGFFAYYDHKKLRYIYMKGKQYYSYTRIKPNFTGWFKNFYAVDEDAYRSKKLEAMKSIMKQEEDRDMSKQVFRFGVLAHFVVSRKKATVKELSEGLNIPASTIYDTIRRVKGLRK